MVFLFLIYAKQAKNQRSVIFAIYWIKILPQFSFSSLIGAISLRYSFSSVVFASRNEGLVTSYVESTFTSRQSMALLDFLSRFQAFEMKILGLNCTLETKIIALSDRWVKLSWCINLNVLLFCTNHIPASRNTHKW